MPTAGEAFAPSIYKGKFPKEILAAKELTPTDKLILMFLYQRAYKDTCVRIRQRVIAQAVGVSHGQVNRSIRRLINCGFLEDDAVVNGVGKLLEYTILWHPVLDAK
jgi:DNA-binding MarR family transcriptional regulator